MLMDNAGLKDRFSSPDKRQSGFTLVEMLVALAMIVLLALTAHTLIRLNFKQLLYFSQPEHQQLNAMYETWRWLENDILQMRGDVSWNMERSLDETSCLVSWTFATENYPAIGVAQPLMMRVRYRVEGRTLLREVLKDAEVQMSSVLLSDVECLYPRFWQRRRWTDKPQPGKVIEAISLMLRWKGPTVERLWPVEIPYEAS